MPRRLVVALATVAAALLAFAGTAAAHVTVDPDSAIRGGDARLAFRVPNEKDAASTTKVQVVFPDDAPLAAVSVKANGAWKATVERKPLATPITSDDGQVTDYVASITWEGGHIDPGQFDEFDVSVGPLPKDRTQMTFKALQTYSDGDVVKWIEDSPPGQPEPGHPAPVLKLTAAPAGSTATATTASVRSARTLGIVGIVVGGLGLAAAAAAVGLGLGAARRRARPSPE